MLERKDIERHNRLASDRKAGADPGDLSGADPD